MTLHFGPQPLNHCLKSIPLLITVQQKIIQLCQLNQVLQTLLPTPLPRWCRATHYRQGILVIETANASWLLRLRYEQVRLLSALRQQSLPALAAIEWVINPDFETSGHSAPSRHIKGAMTCKPISLQSAQQLYLLAQRASPNLRTVLLKLAALPQSTPADSAESSKKITKPQQN
jgi:hypothetical protein